MKMNPDITITEMVAMLRENLENYFKCEIGEITVSSYDKPRIVISEDGMVDCDSFKHKAMK